jgi:hypothetical protein
METAQKTTITANARYDVKLRGCQKHIQNRDYDFMSGNHLLQLWDNYCPDRERPEDLANGEWHDLDSDYVIQVIAL